jgi:putative flippase GtrA
MMTGVDVSFVNRLWSRTLLRRLLLYSVAGVSAFVLDLGFIYLFNAVFGVVYYVAVPLGFIIATTLHYFLSRKLAFADSERPMGSGYVYFLIIVGTSLLTVTGIVIFLVETMGASIYLARIITSAFAGAFSFLANTFLNFRVKI